jgi:hypothetical protein
MLGGLGSGVAAGVAAMSLFYLSPPTTVGLDGASSLYEQSSFGDLTPFDDAAAERGT